MNVHTTEKVADHTCMDPQVYRIVEKSTADVCNCLRIF